MSVTGIDHVLIASPLDSDPDARRFYGELLGLAEIERPDSLGGAGGLWFQIGAQEIHIGPDPAFAAARKAHPGLTVLASELDALAARLQAAGVPVRWDERLAGIRRFYATDPWGNRLELRAAP